MNSSDFFNVTLGLKQGEPLSPLLFVLFINDISSIIDINTLSLNDTELLSKYLILFADDIVLFTTCPQSLQEQLNNIHTYSNKWGLKINVNKTKVCIFEKRKQLHKEKFTINNEVIDIVDNFVYLGIHFNSNGTMKTAIKTLSDQALKAYHNLLSLFDRIKLNIKMKLSLFDTMITPILLYGSEIWGAYDCKEIDKVHINFCKRLLGVSKSTPNLAVLGEWGRFPLAIIAKERAIKYWLKIHNSPGSTIHDTFIDLRNSNSQYNGLNV